MDRGVRTTGETPVVRARGRRAGMLVTLLVGLLLLGASPATAHPLGLPAFVRIAATGADTVTVVWNAAPDDVALLGRSLGVDVPPDGSLTREQDAALSGAPELHDALRRGIVVRQAGHACTHERLDVDSIVAAGAVLHLRCPDVVSTVTVEVRLLSDLDDRYLTLVAAGGPDGIVRGMLSGAQPAHDVVLDAAHAEEVLAAAPVASRPRPPDGAGAFGGSLPLERRIIDLLDGPSGVIAVLVGLGIAFGVGAAHGLAPGHGKAVAAAYLVGGRGRPRDAVLLGSAVALMHTGSVLVLGYVLFRATSRPALVELSAWLQAASGLAVVLVGLLLLRRRWQARPDPGRTLHVHAHGGGRPHSHVVAPEVSPLSWRGLAALGAAGGLLPSPSAMLVLFTALAVGRLSYGLTLIAAFSLGLAATVSAVGLTALWGRDVLGERLTAGPVAPALRRYVPVAAAAAVVLLGAALVLRGATVLV